jgi:ubiquinone/menaquinone biosynthesis C-methylase UbiE
LIDDLLAKYRDMEPTFRIMQMDVRDMEFEDSTFDIVFDKGLLDSVLCGTYSTQNCKKMFKEVSRVLKSRGYYICVSYGDPDIRLHYFDNPEY